MEGASHNTIDKNMLSSNDAGVQVLDGSDRNVIDSNYLDADGSEGFEVIFADSNTISHKQIRDTGSGIILESSDTTITDNEIRHSVASACDGCGIGIQIYGNNNRIERNTALDSPRYGIEVDDFQDPGHSPVSGNIPRDNVVNKSGEGITIGPEAGGVVLGTLIEHNLVTNAMDDGIQLHGPSTGLETSTLTGNVAIHNGNLGIDAVPGVIDGGGNHAAANGNPLQCVNVVC
jgi:parallel beta-helix repeat protein